jgi:hypothetical protein
VSDATKKATMKDFVSTETLNVKHARMATDAPASYECDHAPIEMSVQGEG